MAIVHLMKTCVPGLTQISLKWMTLTGCDSLVWATLNLVMTTQNDHLKVCSSFLICFCTWFTISFTGYFINLSGDNSQPQRGGTRAWIFSPEFVPQSTVPKCMTFYYYMYERTIDSAGPSLGSLRVYVKTVTDSGEEMSLIWRLNNHQAQVQCCLSFEANVIIFCQI